MRKLFLILALGFWGILATAQQGKKVPPPKVEQEGVALPKASVNWLFIAGVVVVIGGVLYFLLRPKSVPESKRGMGSRRSSGKTVIPDQPKRTGKRVGFSPDFDPAEMLEEGLETPAEMVREQAPEAAKNVPLKPDATLANPLPANPVKPVEVTMPAGPEVFYMTVPGADGRFSAGAKKAQPAGCLYRFEVLADQPEDALLFFSGDEDDMRNAQAFRDLELLPACTFNGTPDTGSFRFAQKPGRAHFDGLTWAVQQKVEITFL